MNDDDGKHNNLSLDIANLIRDEVNEILSWYDICSDHYEQNVSIDASCVMLADKILNMK